MSELGSSDEGLVEEPLFLKEQLHQIFFII